MKQLVGYYRSLNFQYNWIFFVYAKAERGPLRALN